MPKCITSHNFCLETSTTETTLQFTTKKPRLDCTILSHDHHYERSPKELSSQVQHLQRRNRQLLAEVKREKQKVSRLQKKVFSMKDIIKELRDTRAVSDSALVSLEGIAESDVSQFLERYATNVRQNKSLNEDQGVGTILEKKASRVQYPPAL